MSKEYPLDGLALEIKAHWEKYRPQMFRELEQQGRLDQALHEASERTGEAFRYPGSGFGRPCQLCGEPMLPSISGRGYCLPCGVPPDDFPLVPASATTEEFLRIQRAWVDRGREPSILLGSRKRGERRKARRGRDPSLNEEAKKKLRWMIQQPGWTLKMLAERFVDMKGKHPHPRTIRRTLKKLGLKLKKRPARRS